MVRRPFAPSGALLLTAPVMLACLVGGCTMGPDYAGPPKLAGASDTARFVRASDPALTSAPGVARWWEGLDDPLLTHLVDDALAHSPSIDLAQGRIREARGKLREGKAGLAPSVSPMAMYAHAEAPGLDLGSSSDEDSGSSGGGTSLDFYNIGANASWEPDLFGGKRRGIEASAATVGARYADLADAQVALSAQVAQSYVNLRDAQARVALNKASVERQRRALELNRQRLAAGTASQLEIERLQGQLAGTEAQNVPLETQVLLYKNALAILTGQVPGALDAQLDAPRPVPLPPAEVAIGDPARLIANRPDIRSAERTLAASTAMVGVREAQRMPGIRFTGVLGIGGTSPGDVFDPNNLVALIMPQLSWPLLDFGKGKAQVTQAEAQRDQAEAQYRQAVLKGLQDAEDSLARFGATRRQLAQLASAQQSAHKAASLNAQRTKAGTSSLIDQLDIERQAINADANVEQARAQLTIDYIAVQKALGLGWTPPQAEPGAAAEPVPAGK
ncbi:efflux transporter outer membrane subunit [Novosphingobium sp. 1949]|uniref:Efflux transporter outer membrane subunit n=1 Tax=Novosphingobium organovorum TaxID=2930092 RepID=A0ABT0BI73_9SPHN|nr:efflux transporter outer membrane subunit [Novosphingobium organovorum]MCJ2184766.1 efflux transporter outer membrane subunit [Novosphingobium organovorum]